MADIEQFREHQWVKGREAQTRIERLDVDCPTIRMDMDSTAVYFNIPFL